MAKDNQPRAAQPDRAAALFVLAADIFARQAAAGATQSRSPETVARAAVEHARAFLRAWDDSHGQAAGPAAGAP